MKNKKQLLLFIFFVILILFWSLGIILGFFSISSGEGQVVYAEEKMEFEIVGNEEYSKNKIFKVVVPDNGFEEWDKYIWENDVSFSDNIIHISAKIEDINYLKIFISKELDNIKINNALKKYNEAARDGIYSKRVKERLNNIDVYYYQRYNNIDTRKAYEFVIKKDNEIFYIEGSYRLGEEEIFERIIRQLILSIEKN